VYYLNPNKKEKDVETQTQTFKYRPLIFVNSNEKTDGVSFHDYVMKDCDID
jgi:hypothetical protein